MSIDRELFAATTANRLLLADYLESLDDAAWATPSLCRGWTVQDAAAHLLQPMTIGFGRFFLVSLRYRGDTDRTVDHLAHLLARRGRQQIVADMRGHAYDEVSPPRVGPIGPFADSCIHLRDIARPLASDLDVPVEHWRIVLDYLVSPSAVAQLIRPGTTTGIRLVATDADWEYGDGPEVRGTTEALTMALTGRKVALEDLKGPGVEELRARLP